MHERAVSEETKGVGFELVSPVLSGETGLRSALEALALLKHMGLQAGPSSGLHMHVNALGEAPGEKLSLRGVAHIWAAWAKYQFVIDEMLSSSRLDNAWARRFFIQEECPPVFGGNSSTPLTKCNENPCPCVQSMFAQMHATLKRRDLESLPRRTFCNLVLQRPDLNLPCDEKYPHQRYFGLNLVPLYEYGTLEFRVHSATYDAERIARWAQFLIAFVERFGNPTHGDASMQTFFDGENWREDFEALGRAQRSATMADLFEELGDMVDGMTKQYYESREWEIGDPACSPPRDTSEDTTIDPQKAKPNKMEVEIALQKFLISSQ